VNSTIIIRLNAAAQPAKAMGCSETKSAARSPVEALVRHARIERMARRIGWAGVLTFAVMLVAAIASIFYKLL
jgi:hypothetical protein